MSWWNLNLDNISLSLLYTDTHFITICSRYVSPDYASTGMLNEGSDVYSFGILLMEMITGRSPIDYSRPAGEVKTSFPL
jgi:serine/threonine protein kinase